MLQYVVYIGGLEYKANRVHQSSTHECLPMCQHVNSLPVLACRVNIAHVSLIQFYVIIYYLIHAKRKSEIHISQRAIFIRY